MKGSRGGLSGGRGAKLRRPPEVKRVVEPEDRGRVDGGGHDGGRRIWAGWWRAEERGRVGGGGRVIEAGMSLRRKGGGWR